MKKYIIFRNVIRKLYNLINLFCFRHMFPFSIPKLQMSNLKTLKTSCKLPKKDWSRPNFTVSRSSSTSITNFTKLIGKFFLKQIGQFFYSSERWRNNVEGVQESNFIKAQFTCLTYGSVNLQDLFLRANGNLRTVHRFTLDFDFLHIRNFTDGPSVHLPLKLFFCL